MAAQRRSGVAANTQRPAAGYLRAQSHTLEKIKPQEQASSALAVALEPHEISRANHDMSWARALVGSSWARECRELVNFSGWYADCCSCRRMLRITRVEDTTSTLHLRLEGRLVGDWVRLLEEELSRSQAPSKRVALDLAGVAFANDAALSLLRRARSDGARLLHCSPLISALLGSSPDEL